MRKALSLLVVGLLLALPAWGDQTVSYNTNSGKYHLPTCTWAKRCTKNCITIPLSEAIAKGGVPCKVCNPPAR